MSNHSFNDRNPRQRANWRLGLAVLMAAIGVPKATAADSTVRFLATGESIHASGPQDARVASAEPTAKVSAALPRAGSSDRSDQQRPDSAKKANEFAHAIREAVALREAIDASGSNAEPVVRERKVQGPTPVTTQQLAAKPIAAAPPAAVRPPSLAAFQTAVPSMPDTVPFAPIGCPYGSGQSGAPFICGVDCGASGAPCCSTWRDTRCIPWSLFGPGEYVGPARTEHLSTYYLRVNDLVTITYIASRRKSAEHYRIGVGDRLRIESSVDESLDREVMVQPDGDITLPLVGEVTAAGKTLKELRDDLLKVFQDVQRQPQVTVTPLEVNAALQDILEAVTSEIGSNGQAQDLRVTPEGTINVPGLGSVYVQGLTLDELGAELEARYTAMFGAGLLISPSLTERATSYVFVAGEVRSPGRFTLEGPTTLMQSIAMAGGWNNGANNRQIVVFRRDENWCLKATRIDVHAPLYGKDPCPVNDVWLRDNDLVIIPKQKVLCAADMIELYFTRGVYAVFPITFVRDFSSGSSVVPVP